MKLWFVHNKKDLYSIIYFDFLRNKRGTLMTNIIGITITNERPENIMRTENVSEYCNFVGIARTGLRFYAQNVDVSCPLARYNLGLQEFDENSTNGLIRSLIGWGDAKSEEIGMTYLKTRIPLKFEEKYIIFFPYPDKDFEPDVIIEFINPINLMAKVRRHTYLTGEPVNCTASGVGALCGECTTIPISTNKPTISLGCNGTREKAKLENNELIIAVPLEKKNYFFD
jgi:uncharacterized protein (DUF169 family)